MDVTNLWAIMFNHRAKKNSRRVLDSLGINQGDTIADIGSGGGYYTFALAQQTGAEGKVYALDTNQKLLARIEKTVNRRHIRNVKTALVDESGRGLPKASFNLVFMRNVFHHLINPASYLRHARESLKPGGRLAIIDYQPGAKGVYAGRAGHSTPEADILRFARDAGLEHIQSFNFLSGQSFNIFRLKMGQGDRTFIPPLNLACDSWHTASYIHNVLIRGYLVQEGFHFKYQDS